MYYGEYISCSSRPSPTSVRRVAIGAKSDTQHMYTQIHLSRVIKVFIHSKVKVVKFGVFPIVDLVLQISKSNFSNVRERGGGQTSKEVTELGLLFFTSMRCDV